MRDHVLLVVIDSATLASIELHPLYDLVDPVHRNNLLDILLFQETMQCYLKLLVVLYISLKSRASPHAEAIETATDSLENFNE